MIFKTILKFLNRYKKTEIVVKSSEIMPTKKLKDRTPKINKAKDVIEDLELGFKIIDKDSIHFKRFEDVSFIKSFKEKNYIRGYATEYLGFIVEYYIVYIIKGQKKKSYITLLLYKKDEVVLKRTTVYTIDTLKDRILKDFKTVIKSYSFIPDMMIEHIAKEFNINSKKYYTLDTAYESLKYADIRCLKNKDLYTLRSEAYKNIIGVQQNYKNYRCYEGIIFEKNNWTTIGQSKVNIGSYNKKNIGDYVRYNLRISKDINFEGSIDVSILKPLDDSQAEYIEMVINGNYIYIMDYFNVLVFFEIEEPSTIKEMDNIFNNTDINILKRIEVDVSEKTKIFARYFDGVMESEIYSSHECKNTIFQFLIKHALSKKDRELMGVKLEGTLDLDEIEMVNLVIY